MKVFKCIIDLMFSTPEAKLITRYKPQQDPEAVAALDKKRAECRAKYQGKFLVEHTPKPH